MHVRQPSAEVSLSPLVLASPGRERKEVKALKPLRQPRVKILLLENIALEAVKTLQSQDFDVTHKTSSWSEAELCANLKNYDVLGIRSKTKVTQNVLKSAPHLLAIGCFCIGTNQVDLDAAARQGVVVFNSPFANSRSVAELVMSEMIALSRQLVDRALEMKSGHWNKVSKACWEIRGKTLGIIGYGHIGSQLSVLAEAFGMNVIYHDIVPIMPLGSARQVESLEELLSQADFVTLHVPEDAETRNMIAAPELSLMKQGSYLINNARGQVVNVPDLCAALESGHVAGAAIDVYPSEPSANGPTFTDALNTWATRLRSIKNVILTPHIGGSTEEAQRLIGLEVSAALGRFLRYGSSLGAVNFPEVDLRLMAPNEPVIRLCFVHKNVPGVLKQINVLLGAYNVEKQFTESRGEIAYLLADIANLKDNEAVLIEEAIEKLDEHIKTRILT